jgi:DNA-directed RNA polymerase specialized sigma24 family protein
VPQAHSAINALLAKAMPRLRDKMLHRPGVHGDRDIADEIVQRTAIKAWEQFGQFDPARSEFNVWFDSLGESVYKHHVRDSMREDSRKVRLDRITPDEQARE